MYKFLNRWFRKFHRWGAVAFAIPLILVIVTGLILQVKKQWTWVQPATQKGKFDSQVNLEQILESAKKDALAKVTSWDDINRMDVRPSKGIVKVQANSGYEIQIDLKSRQVLQTEIRRSDWIESLHDGSFFGDWAKLSVFLINGCVLLVLWITGVYLWYLPHLAKSRKAKRKKLSPPTDSDT